MDLKGKVTAVHKAWGMYPTMAAEDPTTSSKGRVCIDLAGGGRVELELSPEEAKAFPFGAAVTVCVEAGDKPADEDGDE